MQPNLIKLEQLLSSKKAININHKLVKKILGFEDMRDFFEAIHQWGYSRDFTYQRTEYNLQSYLRLWLREEYLNQ